MTKSSDSARLIWLPSFMAAAAFDTYEKAGEMLGADPTTISRRVIDLERWLHVPLVTIGPQYQLTDFGDSFVTIASEVLNLVEKDGLDAELSRTRVLADGTLTVDGAELKTQSALRIGSLMTASRAMPDPNYKPPPPISGKDIVI